VGVVDFAGLPVVVVVVDESVDVDPAELLDFGRVVVVVELGRVVVVVVLVGLGFEVDPVEPDALVVVVVDDFDVDGFVVVVVVDLDGAAGFVVDVVAAAGTLGSSLPGASSRAWVGPAPGAPVGGATAGGGIRSSRRAYCMIRAKTGAETCPP
jgi:hypothetical protein